MPENRIVHGRRNRVPGKLGQEKLATMRLSTLLLWHIGVNPARANRAAIKGTEGFLNHAFEEVEAQMGEQAGSLSIGDCVFPVETAIVEVVRRQLARYKERVIVGLTAIHHGNCIYRDHDIVADDDLISAGYLKAHVIRSDL